MARRRARARRRSILLAGGAAFTVAITTALSIASFAGVDLANATVERAKSLADLLDGRSPGERMKGELIKTKHKTVALAERDVPDAPNKLVEALMPPPEHALVPVTIDVPPIAELMLPTPPGVIFTPPPSDIVPPCCSVVPPPGPPGSPPPPPPGPPPPPPPPGPPPPPPPPAVPEPGTWMTMVVGFGLSGWFMRRQRRPIQVKRSHA